jgi:hypothetical protein
VVSPCYLVDKIIPSRRIHLLAGISSAGKSRFLLPALILWNAGIPLLGLRAYPVPWCMVCGDRPLSDAEDTLASMGFSTSDVDIIPAFGQHNKSSYGIMDEIEKRKYKLVLWEGFDMTVKNPNSPGEVKELLSRITAYCEEGLTIIGSVGVAKLKPHEMYQNPRQLVAGTSLWERATSTNFIIMPTNPKDIEDPNRILYVSLKNSASFTVKGKFDETGILVFDDWANRIHGNMIPDPVHRRNGQK